MNIAQMMLLMKKTSPALLLQTNSAGAITIYWGFTPAGDVMTVDWGDGTAKTSHATSLSHTYTGAGIKTITLTCPSFAKVNKLWVHNMSGLGAFPNLSWYPIITDVRAYGAAYTGGISISSTKLTNFQINVNLLSGALPSFAGNPDLDVFNISTNQFSGTVPSFAACTKLTSWNCNANRFSGALPSFNACTKLTAFDCGTQAVNGAFTGSLPSFAACVDLLTFTCGSNAFSGTIPSFATCTKLTSWRGEDNAFTGYEAGGFATQKNLATLNLSQCNLTSAAIDSILADLVTSLGISGRVVCTVTLASVSGNKDLVGTGNGIASAAGAADITTLKAAGWTVVANEPPKIIVIGDSISTPSQGWIIPFRTAYKSGRHSMTTLAVGGATVTPLGTYVYMSQEVDSPLCAGADIVIVAIGVNQAPWTDSIQTEYEAQLVRIKALNPGAPVFCSGVQDWVNYATYGAGINARISTAATNQSCTYMDPTGVINYITDCLDGLHPNAGGKTKIVNWLITYLPV